MYVGPGVYTCLYIRYLHSHGFLLSRFVNSKNAFSSPFGTHLLPLAPVEGRPSLLLNSTHPNSTGNPFVSASAFPL